MSKNKTFIISDIHGCYDELMALYKQLPINPKKDKMVFCGDYIDRGPDSNKVIQQLIDWKKKYPHWVVLMGNHEHLMLDALLYKGRVYKSFDLWYQQGGKQTHHSYCRDMTLYEKALSRPEDVIPKEHLDFLAGLPAWHEDDNYFYAHGGLIPGEHPKESSSYDLMWVRDGFIISEYDWGKPVIFGHTADYDGHFHPEHEKFKPIQLPNKFFPKASKKIGVDTAVCPPTQNGLTCVEMPTEKFYFQPSF